jgi:hypothetical protein
VLEINAVWTTDGASSGGLTPVQVRFGAAQSVMTLQHSTLTTTQSWSFQTAQESSGPWFIEASTSIAANLSTAESLRITGLGAGFVRPYLHSASTGTYQFRLTGMS